MLLTLLTDGETEAEADEVVELLIIADEGLVTNVLLLILFGVL